MKHELLKKIEDISIDEHVDKGTRDIAKFFLDNFRNIDKISITKVAEKCNTSPTKVTRLSERIGLKGFSELKLRLLDISNSVIIDGDYVNVSERITRNKDVFFDKYIDIHKESFNNQFLYLKNKDMSKFTTAINKARFVYLFAFNLSYNISKNFVQRLRWYDINIISECDPVSIDTYINKISKEDLVFLISISGNNMLVTDLANRLHGRTDLFGIVDSSCKFKDKFNDYLQFETNEIKLWNINSIKAQLVIQLLDFIFVNWIVAR
ncbi:MurR/RpiR family transcriptional regulator [Spiroplasma endosymbiont of Aspidapion aeneum]|uniref:MurR/RpiR family transcriptional regulator n=1 Tax=Spiroplasma endosymbiont of Aspidapion aeneum TaxID=3066276 RepID=UPI00313B6BE8